LRAAVVGGGIAGLSAAWELACLGAEVTVFEPGRPGGKLLTTDFLGRPVDEGPDALLARVPEGVGLCRELGLGDRLVAPAASRALLWSGGRLRPLPEGLVLGAPARLLPLARSGIVSVPGLLRALGDLVLPHRPVQDDASVFDLVAGRFGPEVADKLIEPLVGSIYAGTTRGLSAATVAPQLLRAAGQGRSLLLALRSSGRAAPGPARPGPRTPAARTPGTGEAAFQGLLTGLGSLPSTLVDRLVGDKGARLVGEAVNALEVSGTGVDVVTGAGRTWFDVAVAAVPAPGAAQLLGSVVPGEQGLRHLAATRFSSVAIVTLAFAQGTWDLPADLSGLLVAPGSDMLMTACSFGTNKWPHWSAPGTTVVRVSVGKLGDERWADMDDEVLAGRCCAELGAVLPPGPLRSGIDRHLAPVPLPGGTRVSRWPSALPQYAVGHLSAMSGLREALARTAPMVAVAGASFGRVGVPANIAAGREAARTVHAHATRA
jgi:oxygen-dependent protoporphyrinogen oxidase